MTSDHLQTIPALLAGLGADEWLDQLEDLAEDMGYFEPLGPEHQAVYLKGNNMLLVTFEAANRIRKTPNGEPRSFDLARENGWSVLTIISNEDSWFRHKAIYQFFDALVDDGFFDEFDTVLFHGAGGGGYAACAYSVAAPGSTVMAIRPQATLDPQIAGWDGRFVAQRRQDFTNRYGYAPDMIDAANQVYVLFSPMQKFDAIHAAILTRNNVTKLRVPGVSGRLEVTLDSLQIHNDLISMAMGGTLNPISFAQTMQVLKSSTTYLQGLCKRAIDKGHNHLAANVAAYALKSSDDEFLSKALEMLAEENIYPRQYDKVDAAE